jgi:Ca-activated chloride channel family protein
VHSRCLYAIFFCLAISELPAPAQTSNSFDNAFLAPVATIRTTVDEVSLAFNVTDKRGHFISNLQSSDFELFDNHKEPQKLTYFQQKSDLPLHVAIVMDASSSVEYRLRYEQTAAAVFLKKILRPGIDEALVLAFNDQVNLVQDVTDRWEQCRKALQNVKAHGDTALNDAIIEAAHRLRKIPETQLTRRAIILISDGMDTVNRASLGDAEQAASRADVMIFALTTNPSPIQAAGEGDAVLRRLAESTGGDLLPAREEERFASAFAKVEQALRNQYVVSYNPAEFQADGSFRTVQVVPRKHGLRAICRKGYYARIFGSR